MRKRKFAKKFVKYSKFKTRKFSLVRGYKFAHVNPLIRKKLKFRKFKRTSRFLKTAGRVNSYYFTQNLSSSLQSRRVVTSFNGYTELDFNSPAPITASLYFIHHLYSFKPQPLGLGYTVVSEDMSLVNITHSLNLTPQPLYNSYLTTALNSYISGSTGKYPFKGDALTTMLRCFTTPYSNFMFRKPAGLIYRMGLGMSSLPYEHGQVNSSRNVYSSASAFINLLLDSSQVAPVFNLPYTRFSLRIKLNTLHKLRTRKSVRPSGPKFSQYFKEYVIKFFDKQKKTKKKRKKSKNKLDFRALSGKIRFRRYKARGRRRLVRKRNRVNRSLRGLFQTNLGRVSSPRWDQFDYPHLYSKGVGYSVKQVRRGLSYRSSNVNLVGRKMGLLKNRSYTSTTGFRWVNGMSNNLNPVYMINALSLNPFRLKMLLILSSVSALTRLINATQLTSHTITTASNLTNLVPSTHFSYTFAKKVLSTRINNRFVPQVIPMYHYSVVRFVEFVTGRRALLQFYPFMSQEVEKEHEVRYKLWLPRMAYYERKLGHRFFLEEAIHILHLGFYLRDPSLLANWLKFMILRISFWKTRSIFRFLKYLLNTYFIHVFSDVRIKGMKLKLKGKISAAGNSRKRTIIYRAGLTSHSTVKLGVLHEMTTINTFTGVMGFQVWLFY
jgi:hypothetical protein